MKKYYVFVPLKMVVETDVMEKALMEEYLRTNDKWYIEFLDRLKKDWLVCYAPPGTFEVKL